MQEIDEWTATCGCGCECCQTSEFTVVLTARADGFNGRVPGPTIEARAGDTLVLRLVNELTVATLVELRGVSRSEAALPGGVAELRTRLIEPGVYSYRALADGSAGVRSELDGALIVVRQEPCCRACGRV